MVAAPKDSRARLRRTTPGGMPHLAADVIRFRHRDSIWHDTCVTGVAPNQETHLR